MAILYVDDLRPAGQFTTRGISSEWELARNYEEAVARLLWGDITHIALDHDLGGEEYWEPTPSEDMTGYDIACWIENNILEGFKLPRMTWEVHSKNASGAMRIRAAMESCDRLWDSVDKAKES
jgi:hypothetical protein